MISIPGLSRPLQAVGTVDKWEGFHLERADECHQPAESARFFSIADSTLEQLSQSTSSTLA
jgi:hypothetical protein